MPLKQTGATYANQAQIQRENRFLGEALDDIASQVQSVRKQGNFGIGGTQLPPSAPTAIAIEAVGGVITANITHNNPPPGTNYRLEYSTTPNFLSPVAVDLGEVPQWQSYMPGQKLYVRVAAKFPASALTSYVYFGSQNAPTLVSS